MIFLLLISFLSPLAHAGRAGGGINYQYQAPYLDGRFQCVFQKSIHFGASITHETMRQFPNAAMAPYFMARTGHFFGQSPAKILTKHYARGEVLADFSAAYGNPVGFRQIEQILRSDLLSQATSIVGIDAFYWDAAWQYCGATEKRITSLIRKAREKKVLLILGTVPEENPESVTWNSFGSYREYIWTPPDHACLTSINNTLLRDCKVQNGCFLVDVHGLIQRLNQTGSLALENGKEYSLSELRPDGVHLSDYGSLVLVQEILRTLGKVPHLCGEKP